MLPDPRYSPFSWPFCYAWGAAPDWYTYSVFRLGSWWFPLSRSTTPLIGNGGQVVPRQGDWVFFCRAANRSYGILADGSLWGWGDPPFGNGTLDKYYVPTKVSDGPWKHVSTYGDNTLAIKRDGSLWSWGENNWAQLGIGDFWESFRAYPRAMLSCSVSGVRVDNPIPIDFDRLGWMTFADADPIFEIVKSEEDDPGSGAEFDVAYHWSVLAVKVKTKSAWQSDSLPPVDVSISYQDDERPYEFADCRPIYEYRVSSVSGSVAADAIVAFPEETYPSVTATASNNQGSISITNPGSYTYPPSAKVIGRGAVNVVLERRLVGVQVVSGGKYKSHRISVAVRGCTGAEVSIDGKMFRIDEVRVTNGGSGYTSRPASAFAPDAPSNMAMLGDLSLKCTIPGSDLRRSGPSDNWIVGEVLLAPGPVSSIKAGVQGNFGDKNYWPYTEPLPENLWTHTHVMPFEKTLARQTPFPTNPPTVRIMLADGSLSEPLNVETQTNTDIVGNKSNSFKVSIKEPLFHRYAYAARLVVEWPEQEWPNDFNDPALPVSERASPSTAFYSIRNSSYYATKSSFGYILASSANLEEYAPAVGMELVDDEVITTAQKLGVVRFVNAKLFDESCKQTPYPSGIGQASWWTENDIAYGKRWPSFRSQSIVYEAITNYESLPVGGNSTTPSPSLSALYQHNGGAGASVGWEFTEPSETGGAFGVRFSVEQGGEGYAIEPSVSVCSMATSPVYVDAGCSSCAMGSDMAAACKNAKAYSWGKSVVKRWGKRQVSRVLYGPYGQREQFTVDDVIQTIAMIPTEVKRYDDAADPFYLGRIIGASVLNVGDFPSSGPGWGFDDVSWYPPTTFFNSHSTSVDPFPGFQFLGQMMVSYGPQSQEIKWGPIQSLHNHPWPSPPYRDEIFHSAGDDSNFRPDLASCPNFEPVVQVFSDAGVLFAKTSGHLWMLSKVARVAPGYNLYFPGSSPFWVSDPYTYGGRGHWSLSGDNPFDSHLNQYTTKENAEKTKLYAMSTSFDMTWKWELETLEKKVTGPFQDQTLEFDVCRFSDFEDNSSSEWVEAAEVFVVPAREWEVVVVDGGHGYEDGSKITLVFNDGEAWNGAARWANEEERSLSPETQEANSDTLDIKYNKTIRTYGWLPNGDANTWVEVESPESPYRNMPKAGDPPIVVSKIGYAWNIGRFVSEDDVADVRLNSQGHHRPVPKSLNYSHKRKVVADLVEINGIEAAATAAACHGSLFGFVWPGLVSLGWGQFTKLPTVTIVSESGSGAVVKLCPRYNSPTYPICLTQPSESVGSGSAQKCNSTHFVAGDSLHSLAYPSQPLPEMHQRGEVAKLACGGMEISQQGAFFVPQGRRHVAGDSFYYASPSIPIPQNSGNVEFKITNPGANLRMLPRITLDQPNARVAVAKATINGRAVGVGVIREGMGFTSPPAVSATGGDGSGAQVEAVISGPVSSVEITSGGSGYFVPPRVIFSGPGKPATATCAINGSGQVVSLSITDGGEYRTPPTVTFEPEWCVTSVDVSSGGSYTSTPTVTLIGGSGAGASAECVFDGTSVTGVRVTNPGTGYEIPPVAVFSGGGGNGASAAVSVGRPMQAPAQGTAAIDGGVLFCRIASPGSEYQFPPKLTVSVTAENNRFVKAAVESGATQEQIADIVKSVSPELECRISGKISSVSITKSGQEYFKARDEKDKPPPGWNALPTNAWTGVRNLMPTRAGYPGPDWAPPAGWGDDWSAVVGGPGTRFKPNTFVSFNAESGQITQPSPNKYGSVGYGDVEFLQAPSLRFANSFNLDVERVKGARRTAASVRQTGFRVPADTSLYSALKSLGVSFTSAKIKSIKDFWSSRVFTTSSGKKFRLSDIVFHEPPTFIIDDATGTGLVLSASLGGDGRISGVSISSNPGAGGGYTTDARVRMTRAFVPPVVRQTPCAVGPGGTAEFITTPTDVYLNPQVVVAGRGSGAAAVAVLGSGVGSRRLSGVPLISGGSGYSSPSSAHVYESSVDFMRTEYAKAINDSLASDDSVVEYEFAYPEYAVLNDEARKLPVYNSKETFGASIGASLFYDMYAPYEFTFPSSGGWQADKYDPSLLGTSLPFVDFYAVCEEIESVVCSFEKDYAYDVYQSPPTVTVDGVFDEPPQVAASLASWGDVFGNYTGIYADAAFGTGRSRLEYYAASAIRAE